jgi:hypothetical protein
MSNFPIRISRTGDPSKQTVSDTSTFTNMSDEKELFEDKEPLSNTEVSKFSDVFDDINDIPETQSKIDLTEPTNNMPFILFQENSSIKDSKDKAQIPFMTQSKLAKLYFSSKNIDLVQEKIKKVVYISTKINIDRQSDDELLIVMRSIYLQFGQNCDTNLIEQVKALNDHVVKYCAKNITTNMSMYLKYLSDMKNISRVMPYAKSTNIAGDKTNYNVKGYIGF